MHPVQIQGQHCIWWASDNPFSMCVFQLGIDYIIEHLSNTVCTGIEYSALLCVIML